MPRSFAPRREDLALEAIGLLDIERRLGFAISVQSRGGSRERIVKMTRLGDLVVERAYAKARFIWVAAHWSGTPSRVYSFKASQWAATASFSRVVPPVRLPSSMR